MFDELKPSKPKTEYLSHQRKEHSLTEVMLIIYAQHSSNITLILLLVVSNFNIKLILLYT